MPAARRNIELKARDADPGRTLRLALALGADDRGEILQRDIYFTRARGRLKLREQEPGESELIQYRRADATEARASSYRRVAAAGPEGLKEALHEAYGTLVVVEKRRRLLIWEDVRIHLDDVEGLGSFVELEAVAPPESDLASEHDKVARLRDELRIEDARLVATSYSDLLLESEDRLLRVAEEAMQNAHAPYSGFKVGAALRTPAGTIHAGANVENAAYPQGQCAEASAIGAMVSAGDKEIAAVAVVAERMEFCPPCGGCRQRLSEFGRADTPVYLGRPGGARRDTTLGELLPLAFDLGPS
ncbi:MAG TPA: cytidine deaminase [Thermoleophilaceae bacterium]|nr:cytidine deaminase [Thermoleophilaceae bacterium]